MPGLLAAWDQGVGAWPGIEPTRRAPSSAKAQLVWRTPGARPRCRWAAGPAIDNSRMQFTNTSDATLQTDTNQHNAGGELHATLRNNEQHTSAPGRTR